MPESFWALLPLSLLLMKRSVPTSCLWHCHDNKVICHNSRSSWRCWCQGMLQAGLSTWRASCPVLTQPGWKKGEERGFPLQNKRNSAGLWTLRAALSSNCLAVRFEILYFTDSSKAAFIKCSGSRNDIY